MKNRLAALLMAVTFLLTSFMVTPAVHTTAAAQETLTDQGSDNPFATDDAMRNQAIVTSQKQVDSPPSTKSPQGASAASEEYRDKNTEYLVQFKSSISLRDIYGYISPYTYSLLGNSHERWFRMDIPDLSQFQRNCGGSIDYIGKSTRRYLSAMPNDPYYKDQWALENMNLPSAWDMTKGSEDVKVAVIDSGFYRNHEDLRSSNVLAGYDFYTQRPQVLSDAIGHGTMVTSVIAATTNNAVGMAGGCWNVSVIPYKVAQPDGSIYTSDVVSAIRMAADAGCDVINISLGGYEFDSAEQSAVVYAINKGCIIVAAAGNEGESNDPDRGKLCYPASYSSVISVASIDANNRYSSFSQYNYNVDVCAPGEDIIVASMDGPTSYVQASGTSFSSPYVAAVAALARSREDTINATYFDELIKRSSTDLGTASRDDYYGWGLIHAQKIVEKALSPIVLGVENETYYNTTKTITFNKGTATLNGQPFTSGSAVTISGSYELIVTDVGGNQTIVRFVINPGNPVEGVANGKEYNTDRIITFRMGTATLNGTPIQSGTPVVEEGNYTLVLTLPYSNTVTYTFTIDKSAPVITGVENGASYDRPVTASFNEGKATLNGKSFTTGSMIVLEGNYTLIVTDTAGNVATVTFRISQTYASDVKVSPSSTLSAWVLDEATDTLFTLSGTSVLCINSDTLSIESTIPLSSVPSDIILDNGNLYIALPLQKSIVIMDAASRTIQTTITTTSDPYRIVKDGQKLFYVEQGQHCYMYELDLNTRTDYCLTHLSTFYQPDIAVNTETHIVYIGESGSSGSQLKYYSITMDKITSTTADRFYGYPYAKRFTLFDGKNVYFAGHSFDAGSAQRINGDFSNYITVIFAKYGCVFTAYGVYDEATYLLAGSFPTEIAMVEASSDGRLYLYDQKNNIAMRFNMPSGTVNPAEIAEQTPCIPPPTFPTVTGIQTAPDRWELNSPSTFTNMLYDEATDILFTISPADKALYCLNSETLSIEQTLLFKSAPTDLEIDNGKLYVALSDAKQIVVINLATLVVEKTIRTALDPYSIAIDGEWAFYAQKSQNMNIYKVNLSDQTESTIIISSCINPDLVVDRNTHQLYIGCTGNYGSNVIVWQYSIPENKLVSQVSEFYDSPYYVPERLILLDGENVYFAGCSFDASCVQRINGDIYGRQTILLSKNGCILTSDNLCDRETYQKRGTLPMKLRLAAASSDGRIYLYDVNNHLIKIDLASDTVNANDMLKQIPCVPTPVIPSTAESTLTAPGEWDLPVSAYIDRMQYDKNSDTLLAYSSSNQTMFFIDNRTMALTDTIRLTSSPYDMTISDGKVYVALKYIRQIVVIDIATRTVLQILHTEFSPSSIAIDGNQLFYVRRQDVNLYKIDLTSLTETSLGFINYGNATLAVNTSDHILYIGQSYSSTSKLIYFSTTELKQIGSTSLNSSDYVVRFSGLYVYFNGIAYDPLLPNTVCDIWQSYGETVLAAKYGMVITNIGAYTEEEFEWMGDFDTPLSIAELSDQWDLYLYKSLIITKWKGTVAPPVVTGVEDGFSYLDSVTITFDKGTALLDGLSFVSGSTVTKAGDHTLVITDQDGFETILTFSIYASLPDDHEPVAIPDVNLRQALLDYGADRDGKGDITRGEMRILSRQLYLSDCGITNLTGLEYAVNTQELDLSLNAINDITALASLTKLTNLSLYGNQISDISVLQNLTLLGRDGGWLDLDDNQISDIRPLSELINLNTLYLSGNQITSLEPLTNLTGLTTLYLADNDIISMSPLADLINLSELVLSGNRITDLDALSGLYQLTILECDNNQITDITGLTNLSVLERISLSNNQITNIDALFYKRMLIYLDLSKNRISKISKLSSNLYLMYLDLSSNRVDFVDALENLEQLMYLNLADNEIGNIGPLEDLYLMELDVSGNFLDLSENSDDQAILDSMLYWNAELVLISEPQKPLSEAVPPVITVLPYSTTPTNQPVTVNVVSDKGNLNATSYTFTQNGSFQFIATDSVGKSSTVTVTTTHIDKILPVITGVTNNGLYNSDRTITFNEGTATLNGQPFVNGSTVSNDGVYILVVTDAAGNTRSVTFTLDKTPSVITINPYSTAKTRSPIQVTASTNEGVLNTSSHTFLNNGSFDFIATDSAGNRTVKTVTITNIDTTAPFVTGVVNNFIYNNSQIMTFNEGTATLNSAAFTNGSTVSAEGQYTLIVVDEAGNKTTLNFTIDKTPPVITIEPYITGPTFGPVTVKASVNEGALKISVYTFTQNGSFDFIATDAAGNKTTKTVTVTNIITNPDVSVVKGDVNQNTKVDGLDLLQLKKYLLGQIALTALQQQAADVTGDGKVDGLDLLRLKKHLLGQVTL